MRKGQRLNLEQIEQLRLAGIATVMAAREEPEDLHENAAAERLAYALVPWPDLQGLRVGPARHGRVNLFASREGLFRVRPHLVMAFNQISESVALSTLSNWCRVAAGQLVATVKVIPFAVREEAVVRVREALPFDQPALEVRPVRIRSAALVTTRGEWTPAKLPARGIDAVRARLGSLSIPLTSAAEVPHAMEPLAEALSESSAELLLVLGDTVTSDRGDVAPQAIIRAGGRILRFGMPVDPGNLLLLAELGGRPVIVLPGCARSPKLNGADWVLERIACGVQLGDADFAAMGVGGLLHEIASRPAPRLGGTEVPPVPTIPVLLLAAGTSRRMEGSHKLLRTVDGVPLAALSASRLADSLASEIVAVVGPRREEMARALHVHAPERVRVLENQLHEEGIGASIRVGIAAVAEDADAVVIALADMPEIDASDIDRLIRSYNPAKGAGICRLVGPNGEPGHPVLFGKRYFEALAALTGDRGARDVLLEHCRDVLDLEATAEKLVDLDTETDWARWLARRAILEGQAE